MSGSRTAGLHTLPSLCVHSNGKWLLIRAVRKTWQFRMFVRRAQDGSQERPSRLPRRPGRLVGPEGSLRAASDDPLHTKHAALATPLSSYPGLPQARVQTLDSSVDAIGNWFCVHVFPLPVLRPTHSTRSRLGGHATLAMSHEFDDLWFVV